MSINKLNIVNGIIQDNSIDGIPVKRNIVDPKGLKNVRTLIKMSQTIGITYHNTGNSAPTAGDEAHAKWLQNVENADKEYVSVHFFVDENSITQTVPIDEVTYHAGDGKGNGNYKTISIEICENANIQKAEENAQKLGAALRKTFNGLNIYKHQDWNGKFCPHVILSRGGWDKFKNDIYKLEAGSNIDNSQINAPTDTIEIQTDIYGYKTAADAMADKNRVKIVPKGSYKIMIKHSSGAWNIGEGYLFWINPNKVQNQQNNSSNIINETTVRITNNSIYGYRTAADAMADKNRVRTVPQGTYTIMIKHSSGAWNIGKGYLFWINPNKLNTAVSTGTRTMKVNAKIGVNIRKTPEVNATNKIGAIAYGETVTITEEKNGWVKAAYKNYNGWIFKENLI